MLVIPACFHVFSFHYLSLCDIRFWECNSYEHSMLHLKEISRRKVCVGLMWWLGPAGTGWTVVHCVVVTEVFCDPLVLAATLVGLHCFSSFLHLLPSLCWSMPPEISVGFADVTKSITTNKQTEQPLHSLTVLSAIRCVSVFYCYVVMMSQ